MNSFKRALRFGKLYLILDTHQSTLNYRELNEIDKKFNKKKSIIQMIVADKYPDFSQAMNFPDFEEDDYYNGISGEAINARF